MSQMLMNWLIVLRTWEGWKIKRILKKNMATGMKKKKNSLKLKRVRKET